MGGSTPLVENAKGNATGTSFKRCDFNTEELDEKFAVFGANVPVRSIDIRDFYEPVVEEEEADS